MIRVLIALLLSGCGASPAPVGSGNPAPNSEPVELSVYTPEGATLSLSEMRGQPLILFIFATFDGVSQASLEPLRRMLQRHPEVIVVGVAAQPNAEVFVDAWVHALDPPFVTGFDGTGEIARGLSDLGPLEAVPTFVAVSAEGVIVDRHVGFPHPSDLERLAEAARQ